MKTIIAGSRDINDYSVLEEAINKHCKWTISEIFSGNARGPDRLGERYAKEHNIPLRVFKPDWSIGKRAGLLRNLDMIAEADALIALWDGKSRGTQHCFEEAKKAGLKVIIVKVNYWNNNAD